MFEISSRFLHSALCSFWLVNSIGCKFIPSLLPPLPLSFNPSEEIKKQRKEEERKVVQRGAALKPNASQPLINGAINFFCLVSQKKRQRRKREKRARIINGPQHSFHLSRSSLPSGAQFLFLVFKLLIDSEMILLSSNSSSGNLK
jgi:hypothetical protein